MKYVQRRYVGVRLKQLQREEWNETTPRVECLHQLYRTQRCSEATAVAAPSRRTLKVSEPMLAENVKVRWQLV